MKFLISCLSEIYSFITGRTLKPLFLARDRQTQLAKNQFTNCDASEIDAKENPISVLRPSDTREIVIAPPSSVTPMEVK